VPFIDLAGSPLANGISPVRIHYRDAGAGSPIVFLHSGWGYEIYPFDRQAAAFAPTHRIVAPDRSGYGKSTLIDSLPPDFHARAADETRALIEALHLQRPVVWGHSDGAIIALLLALRAPATVGGVIAEATHYYKRKPRSRAFFESMRNEPRTLGGGVAEILARDHGDGWPDVIARHSRAWQRIAEDASSESDDFYGGTLGEIAVPALVVHGARDPRTEPGEIEAIEHAFHSVRDVRLQTDLGVGPAKAGRHVQLTVLPAGGHSPHSDPATADEVARLVRAFIETAASDPPAVPARPGLPGS
jgi:pimeloyl-ACP methyl ester carboxylesterase